ncbi:hypothetical protein ABPG77_009260 [Micractinium sp. CCAP 211/92]
MAEATGQSRGAATVALAAATAVLLAAAAALALGAAVPPGFWLRLPTRQQLLRLQPKQTGSLLTPSQLAKWRQFASSRQCSLADGDYSQIFSDLAPFRRAGGISDADVAAAASALPAATAVLTVRGGRTMDEEEAAAVEGAAGQGSPARQKQPPSIGPRRRLPWGGLGYYQRLMADFQRDLPDMKLLFNFGDRPRSWAAPLPPPDEAALRDGTLSLQAAWERHGCDAAVGPGMRRRHGLFQRVPFWGARGPLPVLSGWRVEGCFSGEAAAGWQARRPRAVIALHPWQGCRAVHHVQVSCNLCCDPPSSMQPTPCAACTCPLLFLACLPACDSDILVPHSWNNKGNVTRLTLSSGCPLSTGEWTSKSDVAFWRGSSTGGHVDSSVQPEVWRGFQRQRLVALSRSNPGLLDAAFTRFTQCDPAGCAAMEAEYGRAAFADTAQLFSHKCLVVVDGNGAAARLGPTLCSGSLALNAQLFREWFLFRLRPFRHYIPVRPDYGDLLDRIRWARQHDAEAAQIAANAVSFVNTQLRTEDLQCYLYRLLLEYGALYRPGQPQEAAAGSSGGGTNATAAPPGRPEARDRPP